MIGVEPATNRELQPSAFARGATTGRCALVFAAQPATESERTPASAREYPIRDARVRIEPPLAPDPSARCLVVSCKRRLRRPRRFRQRRCFENESDRWVYPPGPPDTCPMGQVGATRPEQGTRRVD